MLVALINLLFITFDWLDRRKYFTSDIRADDNFSCTFGVIYNECINCHLLYLNVFCL